MEITIIDGGSIDSSNELCREKFGYLKNVRLMKKAKSMGAVNTTNKFIKEARDKYISILYCDDFLLSHALKNLSQLAEAINDYCIERARSTDGNGSIINPNSKLYSFMKNTTSAAGKYIAGCIAQEMEEF